MLAEKPDKIDAPRPLVAETASPPKNHVISQPTVAGPTEILRFLCPFSKPPLTLEVAGNRRQLLHLVAPPRQPSASSLHNHSPATASLPPLKPDRPDVLSVPESEIALPSPRFGRGNQGISGANGRTREKPPAKRCRDSRSHVGEGGEGSVNQTISAKKEPAAEAWGEWGSSRSVPATAG